MTNRDAQQLCGRLDIDELREPKLLMLIGASPVPPSSTLPYIELMTGRKPVLPKEARIGHNYFAPAVVDRW
ncbi:MAG TPA: hypothetical protein VIJ34_05095 [Acidimicrobiales bacterium]